MYPIARCRKAVPWCLPCSGRFSVLKGSSWLGCYVVCRCFLVSDDGKMASDHGSQRAECKVVVMTPGKASLEMSASIGRSKEMALITSREYPAIMNSPRSIADHRPHMIYMKPSWIQKNSCASGYAAGLSQEAYLALAANVYPTQLTRGRRRPLWQPHKTHCEQPPNALISRLNVLTEFSCRELPWAAFFFLGSAPSNAPKISRSSLPRATAQKRLYWRIKGRSDLRARLMHSKPIFVMLLAGPWRYRFTSLALAQI